MREILKNKKVISDEVRPAKNEKAVNLEIKITESDDDLLQLSVKGPANISAILKLFEFVSGTLVEHYNCTPDNIKELVDYMFDKED